MRYHVSFEVEIDREYQLTIDSILGPKIYKYVIPPIKFEEIEEHNKPKYTLILGDGKEEVREWEKDYRRNN